MTRIRPSYVLAALALAWSAAPALATPDPQLEKLASVILEATSSDKVDQVVARFEPDLAAGYAKVELQTADASENFDWLTNSVEPDMQALQMTIDSKVDQTSATEATIKITFLQGGDPFEIDYIARKYNEEWLIYDVTYPSEEFSLRELINAN